MSFFSKISGLFIIFIILACLGGCKSNEPLAETEEPVVIEETDVVVKDTGATNPIKDEPFIEVTNTDDEVIPSKETMPMEESESHVADEGYETTKSTMIKTREIISVASAPLREGEAGPGDGKAIRIKPGDGPAPKAGQLTAAEWNDLYNWKDWNELLNNQDYNEMQTHWQIFPRSRYAVFVKNKYELPIQDVRVELLDQAGRVLWSARTDNSGKAELWADINNREKSFDLLNARVTANRTSHIIERLKTIEEGVNHIEVDMECRTSPYVDILFTVDATGSMGDEIRYLQSELQDVITRSTAGNSTLRVRMGAVFYRDSSDQYVTRVEPFSDDPQKTLAFIGEQEAKGGGDYPEAVDAALEESLAQDWSEEAVARIIFLVLDAPPHHNDSVLTRIQKQVADAAKEGIKIIPITASGINRQTEFLMKFMAIATNGTYVFITDHSGIGNPHLDPVVQDYEVEKLNDLLVRLLYNYTKSNGCNANEPLADGISIFPNPASDHINITTDKPIRTLKVLSNSGKLMTTQSDIATGETRIDLAGLIDGVYTIQCTSDGTERAYPFVLINGR